MSARAGRDSAQIADINTAIATRTFFHMGLYLRMALFQDLFLSQLSLRFQTMASKVCLMLKAWVW